MVTSGLNPETIDKYQQVSIEPSLLLILFTYHTIVGAKQITIWGVLTTFVIRASGCVLEWFYLGGFVVGSFVLEGFYAVMYALSLRYCCSQGFALLDLCKPLSFYFARKNKMTVLRCRPYDGNNENTRNEEIRPMADVANISDHMRERDRDG